MPDTERQGACADGASTGDDDALYLYGLVEDGGELPPDLTGVAGAPVRVIPAGAVSVLAHLCRPVPYASPDGDTVLRWIEAHADVLARALTRYPCVIPFTFNTIVHRQGERPEGVLARWIAAREPECATLLDRLRGRREFGVHVRAAARDAGAAGQPAATPDGLPPGVAYLMRARAIPSFVRDAGWQPAAERCLARLRSLSDGVRVESRRGTASGATSRHSPTILRASCLVHAGAVEGFLAGVGESATREDVEIEVTGPWPPYSFVTPQPDCTTTA